MDGVINSDLKSIQIIYDRNKGYIFPFIIILVSIILFFQFVIPQFRSLLDARSEAKEASAKLDKLQADLNLLQNSDEATLNSELSTLDKALPIEKDFSGILNAIYSSAQTTGVNLGAFSIVIGDLAKSDGLEKFPKITLTIPIDGGIEQMNSFVDSISNTLPLSEVTLINKKEKGSTVDVSFYYKPLDASENDGSANIVPISKEDLQLIERLKGFESAGPLTIESVVSPTPSIAPSPSPVASESAAASESANPS